MKIITVSDYREMSVVGAEIVKEVLRNNKNAVLGLATGTTPIGLYDNLVAAYEKGEISFKAVKTVNLDEYVGLGAESRQSYVHFMRETLFDRVDIDLKNTNLPDGLAPDLQAECVRYNDVLNALTQDIQLLGLGSDGHVGFNEPGSPFDGRTHVAVLAESTVKDNARLFERAEDVPRRAITMGIADIMRARKILVMACGENKAKAVYGMVKGAIDESCPASVLQRHENTVLVVDKTAAKLL